MISHSNIDHSECNMSIRNYFLYDNKIQRIYATISTIDLKYGCVEFLLANS
jgi:hypothetical protein